MVGRPLVSVIIATYNRSNVLRLAIESVLWQEMEDWELIVVGDGCTDDSREVVFSFNALRIRWFNLLQNSGGQSVPNNFGISKADGDYIAYLGHDDLWYKDHLLHTTRTIIDRRADMVYALSALYSGDSDYVTGITNDCLFELGMGLPASSLVHRRHLIEEIGEWPAYETLEFSPDQDLIQRADAVGKKIVCSPELSVFKIPAIHYPNCYPERRSKEQDDLWLRMKTEPEFRYIETLKLLKDNYNHKRSIRVGRDKNLQGLMRHLRNVRGLPIEEPSRF